MLPFYVEALDKSIDKLDVIPFCKFQCTRYESVLTCITMYRLNEDNISLLDFPLMLA